MAGLPPQISPRDRTCLNCKHFEFNPARPKKLNRECMFDGPIVTKYGVCQMWEDMRTEEEKANDIFPQKTFC